jgi:Domain of unknown function (DUF4279)
MRVKQEAYLLIYSAVLSPAHITQRLGIEPDVQQKKSLSRKAHKWGLLTRCPEWALLRVQPWDNTHNVTAQLVDLVERLEPVAEEIRDIAQHERTSAVLRVVRWYFPSADEVELSFHLDLRVLQFLINAGVELDVSEYDMSLANDSDLQLAREGTWGESSA